MNKPGRASASPGFFRMLAVSREPKGQGLRSLYSSIDTDN